MMGEEKGEKEEVKVRAPEEEVKVEKKPEAGEAEEIKEILEVITPFLEKLKDMVKEIIATITSSLDGKKLGEEVSSLYKELKNSGLPDDIVNEMVKDFYRKKLETAPSINEVLKSIAEAIKGKRAKIVIGEEEEEEGEEEEEEEE